MQITVQVSDREVRDALNRLREAGADMTPAMRDIAAAMESTAQAAFQHQRSPDGEKWPDLSEHTKARRRKRRKWPGQILHVSGRLAASISSSYNADSAIAGTNLIYAVTHQFGAARGKFGSTRRGRPIPFGDIPARPFFGISDDLKDEVLDVLAEHLTNAITGR